MQGWIKLLRKLLDWEWYTDVDVFKLFIHLLLIVNHQPKKWRGTTIEKGATVTSISSLAAGSGLSEQKVRTALKKLLSTGEITKKSTNKNTVILVVNYALYQSFEEPLQEIKQQAEQQTEQQATNNQLTINQQTTNNKQECKNDKKVKNDKKEIDYSAVAETYNSICKSLPEVKVMTDTRKTHLKSFLDILKKHDLTVDEYFRRVQDSDFLSGRNGKWTNCSFDWLINKSNAVKVCEGTYKNTGTAVQTYCEY